MATTSSQPSLAQSLPPAPFSYAEAAKGKSSAATTAPQSSKTPSGATTPSKDLAQPVSSRPQTGSNGVLEVKPTESSSPPSTPNPSILKSAGTEVAGTQDSNLAAVPGISSRESSAARAISTPSSPGVGASSTSTLPKDDDVSITANASSDSTWDKQSQSSNTIDKSLESTTADREDEIKPEEKSEKVVPFVAAPIPVVNVWQQRREAQEAKTKVAPKQVASPPPALASNATNSNVRPAAVPVGKATQEASIVQPKAEPKKKPAVANSTLPENDENVKPTAPGTTNQPREKKKNADGPSKTKEDQSKKPAPRQKALAEKGRDVTSTVAPPPVGDSMSWPTPLSAQDEEKKKAMEKAGKGDKDRPLTINTKPHGKEKWTPVPYTPTVVFETQMSSARRGGRLGRGGRDAGRGGHATTGSQGGDKAAVGGNTSPTSASLHETTERGRKDSIPGKSASGTPRGARRASSAGPHVGREHRKSNATLPEKGKESGFGSTKAPDSRNNPSATTSRRTSIATQGDTGTKGVQEHRQRGEAGGFHGHRQNSSQRFDRNGSAFGEGHGQPRSAGLDRRGDGSSRHSENLRDTSGYSQSRDRGENRSERGRGGHRGGRGAATGFANSQHHAIPPFPNGHSPNPANPMAYPFQKPLSFSPHQHQPQHGPQVPGQFGAGPQQQGSRSYRGGPRSQSIPSSATLARFPGLVNSPPQMAPLQTQMSPMQDYAPPMQSLSAMPYHALLDQYSILSMVSLQLEYYFSVDNLCKDLFLRKHMDSQGFVFLSVIASFNRIRQLTQDMDLVRFACLQSNTIEFFQGSDGMDRIRKGDGWQQWVLAMEERDASAQNDGPSGAQEIQPLQHYGVDGAQMDLGSQSASPRDMHFSGEHPDEVFYGSPPEFGGSPTQHPPPPLANGTSSGGQRQTSGDQLSASVQAFFPSKDLYPVNGTQTPDASSVEDAFSDEQVDNLVIVVRSQGSSRPETVFPPAASRTFSNGSIDERSIADAINPRPSRSLARSTNNGNVDADASRSTRSPPGSTSPAPASQDDPPPVFWVKDRESPIGAFPNEVSHESYNTFRRNALRQRDLSLSGDCHHDMDVLFQFWSHFLVRNFNSRMYNEFRVLAVEDATQKHSDSGLKNLIQYYDVSLKSNKVIPDLLAQHYVELVEKEDATKERPGFTKMRAAWRNGALNMKNRKKIDNFVSRELKAELER